MGSIHDIRRTRGHAKLRRSIIRPVLAIGLAFGVGAAASEFELAKVPSLLVSNSDCRDIKGNISINTGERIYHVPGQEFYSDTRISAMYGERWFCTEAEAVTAGWRRAYR